MTSPFTVEMGADEYYAELRVAHRQGFEDALRTYGQYDNGVQRIGAMAHSIADCLAEYDSGRLDPILNKPDQNETP